MLYPEIGKVGKNEFLSLSDLTYIYNIYIYKSGSVNRKWANLSLTQPYQSIKRIYLNITFNILAKFGGKRGRGSNIFLLFLLGCYISCYNQKARLTLK